MAKAAAGKAGKPMTKSALFAALAETTGLKKAWKRLMHTCTRQCGRE